MYLVLSALTSSPISLVAATKASAFSFRVCMLPPSIQPYISIMYIKSRQYQVMQLVGRLCRTVFY